MSASAWSGTSSASPKPPSACRTTATFSGREGSVSSRSGVTCSAATSRSGALPASSAVVPTDISFHSRRSPGRRSVVLTRTNPYSRVHRPAEAFATLPAPSPRPPRRRPRERFMSLRNQPPQADGLYDPRFEHDACGVAMVARLDNRPTHEVVDRALEALDNLEHRGAEGADVRTGDGAGILTQMPDAFFRGVVDFELPPPGRYGVGVCFLPHDETHRDQIEQLVERNVRVEGQHVLGWRDVPIDEAHVGDSANACRPHIRQIFVGAGPHHDEDQDAFERKLYVIRRIVELAAGPDFYAPSFSSRTCVYKGMLISHQLRGFYPDLRDERFASGMALVHSRFSTNTFPSWELAHPYRVIFQNGENKTRMGNDNC